MDKTKSPALRHAQKPPTPDLVHVEGGAAISISQGSSTPRFIALSPHLTRWIGILLYTALDMHTFCLPRLFHSTGLSP